VQLLVIAVVLAAGLALWYLLLLRPARNMGTRAATLRHHAFFTVIDMRINVALMIGCSCTSLVAAGWQSAVPLAT
jgi:hypothetical protein